MAGTTRASANEFVRMLLANDEASRSPFVERLLDDARDPDPMARWRAALALGSLGAADPRAIAALVAALHDTSETVRRFASRSLVEIGAPAVPALASELAAPDGRAVVATLSTIGAPAIDVLVSRLPDEDPRVRWAAATALEDVGDDRAVGALIGVLSDADGRARDCAVSALGHIGVRAAGPLLAALAGGDDAVRSNAASALGLIGDTRAFMPLIVALDDRSSEVRGCAAWALGGLRDPRAFLPLLVALEDDDGRARAGAAAGLGRLGDARAVSPLISALDDEDERVRGRAVSALGELGARRGVPFLVATLLYDGSEPVRCAAADALGDLGSVAVAPLLEALDGEGEEARSWVALALEAVGEESIMRALAQASSGERPPELAQIREALGWADDKGDEALRAPEPADEDDGHAPETVAACCDRSRPLARQPRRRHEAKAC